MIKSDDEVRIEFTKKQRVTKYLAKKDGIRRLMITLIIFGIAKRGIYLSSKNLQDYVDRISKEDL
jgi:hypothetical protein